MSRFIVVYALVMVLLLSLSVVGMIGLGMSTGTVLSFLSYNRTEIPDVFLVDIERDKSLQLTDSAYAFELAWSPDGSMFATSWDAIGSFPYIIIWDRSGREISAIWSELGAVSHPNWLQDNQTILFELLPMEWSELYSADIHHPQAWSTRIADESVYGYRNMSLSPDNNFIAYSALSDGIYILNLAEGSTVHPILEGDYPSWSPDGQLIAYSMYDENYISNIYIFDRQRSTSHQLTDMSWASQPAWSPDGTQIAFVSSDSGADDEIYIMNADGTNVRQVTFNDVNDSNPAWMP